MQIDFKSSYSKRNAYDENKFPEIYEFNCESFWLQFTNWKNCTFLSLDNKQSRACCYFGLGAFFGGQIVNTVKLAFRQYLDIIPININYLYTYGSAGSVSVFEIGFRCFRSIRFSVSLFFVKKDYSVDYTVNYLIVWTMMNYGTLLKRCCLNCRYQDAELANIWK